MSFLVQNCLDKTYIERISQETRILKSSKLDWSVEDVMRFASLIKIDEPLSDIIENQAIDGEALFNLGFLSNQAEMITGAHYFSAGNVALVTTDDLAWLDSDLTQLGLNGLVLRGEHAHPILGKQSWLTLAKRVKQALDPHSKFLDI